MRRRRAAATTVAAALALVGCVASEPAVLPPPQPTPSTAPPTPSTAPGTPTPAPGDGEAAGPRDPLLWPYPADSIWNMPLGDDAVLVPARLTQPTGRTLNVEEDILLLEPDAPLRPVLAHDAGWRDGVTRCGARTGDVLLEAVPVPDGFVTDPGYHGTKPNHAAAVVLPDLTLVETQPLHVCPDGTVVSQFASERGRGDSLLEGGQGGSGGSHGGSGLTAFGGTVRLGEWVPGGRIPHSLKVVVDAADLSDTAGGFRWPALRADRTWASTYTGDVPPLRMGALLALPPAFDVDALTSEPARILARALAQHGAYVVDVTGWSTMAFAVEWSPEGRVLDEFADVWGFPMVGRVGEAAGPQADFLADVEQVYAALHVVEDNGPDNVGGAGARLAPMAPPLQVRQP